MQVMEAVLSYFPFGCSNLDPQRLDDHTARWASNTLADETLNYLP